ncbi:hypothetical protein ACWDSJ_29620 [Nocardia sp. NPDC003482]
MLDPITTRVEPFEGRAQIPRGDQPRAAVDNLQQQQRPIERLDAERRRDQRVEFPREMSDHHVRYHIRLVHAGITDRLLPAHLSSPGST